MPKNRPSAPTTAALRALKAATTPTASRQPVVSETARRRALRATLPQQADDSLEAALRPQIATQARHSPPRVLALLTVALLIGAGFALIRAGTAYIASAAGLGALTCGVILWQRARQAQHGRPNEPLDLAAEFDRLVHRHGMAWPETVTVAMAELRQALSRLLPVFPAALADGCLTLENGFFIRQTILSYLPDALNRYTAIPATHRNQPQATSGRSPEQALAAQIMDLTRKLLAIEAELAAARARQLEIQARFIDQKTSG